MDEQIKNKKSSKKDWVIIGLTGALYFSLIFYIRGQDAKIKKQELTECLKNSSIISIGESFNLYEICKNLFNDKGLRPYKNLDICIEDLIYINSKAQKASNKVYFRSQEEIKECLKNKEKSSLDKYK